MAAKKTGGVKSTKATSASTKKNTAKKPVKKVSSKTKKQQSVKETKERPTPKVQKPTPEKLSDIYTASGVRLTVKEAKFIDKYVETGNQLQSVKAAGYAGLPGPVGTKLLHKDYIKAEIEYRLNKSAKKSIADREEIMQFWTNMMRGEILDQFDMPTTNADKLKAAAELAKRGMDIEDRIREKATSGAPEIKISLDWGGMPNGSQE